MNGPLTPIAPEGGDTVRCKVKVDFGWNREEKYVHWQGKLSVDKGQIHSVTPCFRGAAFTSPQEGETEFHTCPTVSYPLATRKPNWICIAAKIRIRLQQPCKPSFWMWKCPKTVRSLPNSMAKKFEHALGELLEGSRSHFMIGWLSEAILFNRAMPERLFHFGTLHGR